MSRSMLALAPDQLTAFDLDAFIAHAHALNQHNRLTFTTPFPKASSRWLSHYEFRFCRKVAFSKVWGSGSH